MNAEAGAVSRPGRQGPDIDPRRLAEAYRYCESLARSHYENFPVASRLLPPRLRRPVAVIYAFARRADDYADEGDPDPRRRLALLAGWQARLEQVRAGRVPLEEPVFVALADVVARHALPWALFEDLLSAFRQDVVKRRYARFDEVLDYCRRSANPIGRLLLHLHGSPGETALRRADAICTALQLINFLQDIAQDQAENDRIYLPQDEMARFGITDADIAARRDDEAMRALLRHQIRRIRTLLDEGAPLAWALGGRLGLELRFTVGGARRILARLEQAPSCYARPRLTPLDWLVIAGRSLRTSWFAPGRR